MDTENFAYHMLGREAWCVPLNLRVLPLDDGQELLTGSFKNQSQRRPFRIVIHDGFHDPQLGPGLWRKLDRQVFDALQHHAGEINIVVSRDRAEPPQTKFVT